MDPETEKIIKEQMDKLPTEVKKLFADPELNNKIISIGKKNGLNTEQLVILQTEINLVILGLVHPDEYPNVLKVRLNISDLKTDNIVNDINKDILGEILEKLKEVYGKHETEEDWKQNLNFILPKWDYSTFENSVGDQIIQN